MSRHSFESLPERPRYLVLLAASPTIWAAHFLLAYCVAAVWWHFPTLNIPPSSP